MAVDNDNDNFEAWVLPVFENNTREDKSESDLFGKPANWYNSQKEGITEVVEEEPQPLTLEDIELIRTSAYEDGFNEGKDAGLLQGLEEGKLQGLGEGHQEGLTQGLAQGLKEGQVKVDAQTLHWQQLVSRLHRPLEKLDDSVEFQLVKLATSLAEQISHCEVMINPNIVLHALKASVSALPINELTMVISFNPEDVEFVQHVFSEAECEKRGWDIRSEPTLLRGDCQVQTKMSRIDYTFSTRIEQVLKNFLKENYLNTPDVSNEGDIHNEDALDYQMITEDDLQKQAALESDAESDQTADVNQHVEVDLTDAETDVKTTDDSIDKAIN